MERTAKIKRKTNETDIEVNLKLEGTGVHNINTSIPFLDHMLAQVSKHGFFDLEIRAKGDTEIDCHHTAEDIGIVLGETFKKALGDKSGICRFGFASIPLNEALANVTVDISGRPFFVYNVELPKGKVGDFDIELVEEFLIAFTAHSGITLHVNVPYGTNTHHIIEAIFKSLGRSLNSAAMPDKRVKGVPSTKGKL